MRRLALIGWIAFCVVLALACARYLTALYLATQGNMPYEVDMMIRAGFRFFLNDDMPDPDDMGAIALLFYFTCATAISGLGVALVGSLVWRRILSPRLRRH
jgi:hypothetical protein